MSPLFQNILLPVVRFACLNGDQIFTSRQRLFEISGRENESRLYIYELNVSSGICGQRRPRSACASAQSDQDHHYPLLEFLGTVEHNEI